MLQIFQISFYKYPKMAKNGSLEKITQNFELFLSRVEPSLCLPG